MFLPDGNYATLVAFIEGFAMGSGRNLLDGFQDWVAMDLRGVRSPQHWGVLAASTVNEGVGSGRAPMSAMSEVEQRRASDLLLELLSRFLQSQS
jgi:hypothetical protein